MEILDFETTDLTDLKTIQPPEWPDVEPHFVFYLDNTFCKPVKLTDNGKLVGIGAMIRHKTTAWLAHIIVHPDYRRRGFGELITNYLVNTAKTEGFESIYLTATPMGENMYTRLGFVTETEYIFMEGKTNGYSQPIHIVPLTEPYREQLKQLDREICGDDRFQHLEHFLEGARLFVKDNELFGYYLPSRNEGFIGAKTQEAGFALMQLRLQEKPVAGIPLESKDALSFLQQHHFKEIKRAKRMYIGKKLEWKPEYFYNRVSGQIG